MQVVIEELKRRMARAEREYQFHTTRGEELSAARMEGYYNAFSEAVQLIEAHQKSEAQNNEGDGAG